MYVVDSLEIVFLAVPRTASRAIAHYLSDEHGARQEAREEGPGGGHHGLSVSRLAWYRGQDYRILGTVRNPFDCLVSWYWHNGISRGFDFPRYVRSWGDTATNRWTRDGSLFGYWLPEVDTVLRFESVERDLEDALGFEIDLPQVGGSSLRRPYPEYYDDDLRAYVEETFAPELEEYGYSFDILPD